MSRRVKIGEPAEGDRRVLWVPLVPLKLGFGWVGCMKI